LKCGRPVSVARRRGQWRLRRKMDCDRASRR